MLGLAVPVVVPISAPTVARSAAARAIRLPSAPYLLARKLESLGSFCRLVFLLMRPRPPGRGKRAKQSNRVKVAACHGQRCRRTTALPPPCTCASSKAQAGRECDARPGSIHAIASRWNEAFCVYSSSSCNSLEHAMHRPRRCASHVPGFSRTTCRRPTTCRRRFIFVHQIR